MKWYNGEKKVVSVRRMRCDRCERLHTELPDVLTPRKHYATEIIENVIDGVSTPDDETTECYPCERTMARWKVWILENKQQIDGYMKSIGTKVFSSGNELLKSEDSLLEKLRKNGAEWLATINRAIYNTGGALLSQKPVVADAPALSWCLAPS